MAGRRCAEWRFPTPKQAKAEETARRLAENQRRRVSVDDEDAWWDAVLRDPRGGTDRPAARLTLGEVQAKELTVSCQRCQRVVREYRRDLIARWGADALWRDVGQRLLNERCEIRTGRHEENGCWPDFR
ncbi:hypothetical protein M2171_002428 [Bradyrhizobium japonicum USDA 38]|uniref:hypothetical protein n=1 Tax=Bradyrhizobium japonicum TaxID=375 RepID=UPI00040496C4|nr:hypothetical protein [Bradyrhizobium japonicum]MCS3893295.1 hypothetical protein [Bradyrhizobium japonicum USDA 38]MCS3945809.1 hypothetical protein [Bradyrhizobium japonicum]